MYSLKRKYSVGYVSAVSNGNSSSLGPPLIFAVGTHFWYLSLLCLYHLGCTRVLLCVPQTFKAYRLPITYFLSFTCIPASPTGHSHHKSHYLALHQTVQSLQTMLPSAPIPDSKSRETWDWKAIQWLLPTHLDLPFFWYQRELIVVVVPASLLLPTL